MFLGIVSGLVAAFLQSGSYVCSRQFLAKYSSSWLLTVYSQLAMGLLGGITLCFVPLGELFSDPARFLLTLAFWIMSMVVGQYSFFRSLREIEASRLASLLGLKILILAAISLVCLVYTTLLITVQFLDLTQGQSVAQELSSVLPLSK